MDRHVPGHRAFRRGFLGAICISLASSWAFGEVFGWAHSLNNKIREAPWFYGSYLLLATRRDCGPYSRGRPWC